VFYFFNGIKEHGNDLVKYTTIATFCHLNGVDI